MFKATLSEFKRACTLINSVQALWNLQVCCRIEGDVDTHASKLWDAWEKSGQNLCVFIPMLSPTETERFYQWVESVVPEMPESEQPPPKQIYFAERTKQPSGFAHLLTQRPIPPPTDTAKKRSPTLGEVAALFKSSTTTSAPEPLPTTHARSIPAKANPNLRFLNSRIAMMEQVGTPVPPELVQERDALAASLGVTLAPPPPKASPRSPPPLPQAPQAPTPQAPAPLPVKGRGAAAEARRSAERAARAKATAAVGAAPKPPVRRSLSRGASLSIRK